MFRRFVFLNRILYFLRQDIWEGCVIFYGIVSSYIFPGASLPEEMHCSYGGQPLVQNVTQQVAPLEAPSDYSAGPFGLVDRSSTHKSLSDRGSLLQSVPTDPVRWRPNY